MSTWVIKGFADKRLDALPFSRLRQYGLRLFRQKGTINSILFSHPGPARIGDNGWCRLSLGSNDFAGDIATRRRARPQRRFGARHHDGDVAKRGADVVTRDAVVVTT